MFTCVVMALCAVAAGEPTTKVVPCEVVRVSTAKVANIVVGESADYIVFDAGMNKNFCVGAYCVIERGNAKVAEVIIADANAEKAVALVTALENNKSVLAGDTVKLKTLTF